MFRFIILIALTISAIQALKTDAGKRNLKIAKYSEHGIRELALQLPPLESGISNAVIMTFKEPKNPLKKIITGYLFYVYEFVNTSHLNLVPHNDLTYVARFHRQDKYKGKSLSFAHKIENLIPKKNYFLIVHVEYAKGEIKSAFSASMHFTYGMKKNGQAVLKSSGKSEFAPALRAIVKKHPNHQELVVSWRSDIPNPTIEYYALRVVSTISNHELYSIVDKLSDKSHTFTSVNKGEEYEITMVAKPYTLDAEADYTSSRIFIKT